MRVVPLDDDVIGRRLGSAVRDAQGRVLLGPGAVLTRPYMRRLLQRGYRSVPVYDPLAPDAVPTEVLQAETRRAVSLAVRACCRQGRGGEPIALPLVEQVIDQILDDLAANPDMALNVAALRNVGEGLFVHCVNVCVFSLVLGCSLALDRSELRHLGIGALLHDIGKVYHTELVNKPARLTAEEYAAIQQHAADGYEILSRQPGMDPRAAHVAYQHHERLDGSGYPRGLRGEEIHLWARIAAVADVYDAMTSDRPHAGAVAPHTALAELHRMAEAGQVEPRFVRHLSQRLAAYPEGSILLLQSGEVAVVIGQTTEGGLRPRVRVLTDTHLGLVEPSERVIDGASPPAAIRSVLGDYPLEVRERLRRPAAG